MERISLLATRSVLTGLLFGAGSVSAAGAAASNVAVLSWAAPTINADGSKLSDLLGYNVYRGTSPTGMMLAASLAAGTNTYADSNLTPSVWYWYVTAVNSLGVESAPSPTVSKVIATGAGAGTTPPGSTPGSSPGTTPGSTTGSTTGSTAGSTTPSTGGSSGGQGAASEAAESPYRASALSAISRRTHCKPVGMVTCFR